MLAIVALVLLITAIWPGTPTWLFPAIVIAVAVSGGVWKILRRWHRRREAAQ
jgi:hypothetical protein